MIHIGQSYRKQPPEGDYDAIIIGSGVGGLATAALLAKHGGKRVLVLERHYMPGVRQYPGSKTQSLPRSGFVQPGALSLFG